MSRTRSTDSGSRLKQGAETGPNEPITEVTATRTVVPVSYAQVAALYIDPKGPYPALVGSEYCWDIERDARTYAGPWPVVAHPPCQLWVNFAALNYKRYGGEHNRPGNDGGCFASALAAVREFGGVLEHPASSNAWRAHDLLRPVARGWNYMGSFEWTCEVWQSAYGHRARKRTWLFYKGHHAPFELRWERPTGTHQVGWFDRIKPTLSKRDASKSPEDFAWTLIELAQVSWTGFRKAEPSAASWRCESIGPPPERFRCGLRSGHDGPHSALSETSSPWVSGSNPKEG